MIPLAAAAARPEPKYAAFMGAGLAWRDPLGITEAVSLFSS
jgi:hypothetical protein